MSTATYERAGWRGAAARLRVRRWLAHTREKASPAARHLREHGYTMTGLACLDAAAFVHSVFAGLIVTGVSFLVLEWRVRE